MRALNSKRKVPAPPPFTAQDALSALLHEINNPLSTLVNAAFALSEREAASPESQRLALAMRSEAERIHRLADNIRMLCRKQSITNERFDLIEIVNDLLLLARLEPGLRNQRQLITHFPEGSLPVKGNAEQIEQVLWNLLLNASRHGIGDVEFEVQVLKSHIRISVRNQYRDSASPSTGGMGLGLSLSSHILHRHNSALCLMKQDGIFEASFLLPRVRKLNTPSGDSRTCAS